MWSGGNAAIRLGCVAGGAELALGPLQPVRPAAQALVDDEVRERPCRGQRCAQRRCAGVLKQPGGVLAVGQRRRGRPGPRRAQQLERPQRGLSAGRVCVECDQHAAGGQVAPAAQRGHLADSEGGTARGDAGLPAGAGGGDRDRVEGALDQHRVGAARQRLPAGGGSKGAGRGAGPVHRRGAGPGGRARRDARRRVGCRRGRRPGDRGGSSRAGDPAGLTAVEQRRVGFYAASAKAAATRRAYLGAWRGFTGWCTSTGRQPLPASPSTVAAFLSFLADTGASLPTVVRHHAAIRHAHVLAGGELPTGSAAVVEVMAGIRCSIGRSPRGKDPLLTPDLALIVSTVNRADPDRDLVALRDRALLLVAFTAALRRSELSALAWSDVTVEAPTADGTDAALVFSIARGKTDQTGTGRLVGVLRSPDPAGRLCPVRALLAWRHALAQDLHAQQAPTGAPDASSVSGPVFRPVTRHGHAGVPGRGATDRLSGDAIAQIIKRHARAAGLDPSVLAAHSLRSGHATQAAKNGAGELAIAEQLGHQHLQTTRRYIRRARAADDGTSGYLGL